MIVSQINRQPRLPLRRFLSLVIAVVVTVQYTIAPLLLLAPRSVRAQEPALGETTESVSIDQKSEPVTGGPESMSSQPEGAAAQASTPPSGAPGDVPAEDLPADVTAPTVTLTSPVSGASLVAATTLTASASDDVGVANVQFFLDGSALGESVTAEPYSLVWDTTGAANGEHALAAEARDAAGNATTSETVTVTVNNAPPVPDAAPPTISIANPPAETVLALVVTLSVDVQDDIGVVGVQYKLDGVPIGPEITEAPFSYEWDSATVPNGNHVLSAEARDAAGNRTTSQNVDIICNNADIENTNSAEIHNTVSADANTGGNSAVGTYDATLCPFYEPSNPACGTVGLTPISTGDATAGVILSTQVNTNVTDVTAGSGGTDLTVNNDNAADLLNDVAASAETGVNTTNNNRQSSIATGDANVFTAVMNMVNTTVVGSNFTTIARDIFDTFIGDIDFVEAILALFQGGLGAGNMDVHNTSTGSITNNVNVNASTGSNTATDNRQSSIATGDINVATNVLNLLNTNIIGANWLFSSINVFGQFIGDIILPGEGVLESLFGTPTTQLTVENDNTAGVVNTVAVNADTGNNMSVNNRDADITTGDVFAQTRVINTLNTNIVNANFFNFTPNILGSWIGREINPWSGSLPNTNVSTDDESSFGVDVSNTARITNNVTINAATGLNSTNGNRYSSINTGDIRAATNLVNVANTNIVGSNWFLGNLNLFGTWQGNVTYAFPDLTLGMEGPVEATPGSQVTYTLSVRNQGRVPGQGVTLVDRLPSNATFVSASDGGTFANGTVTWQFGQMGSVSAPRAVNAVVQLPADLPVGDTLFVNEAVVSTRTPEPQTANNTISGQTVVRIAPPAPVTPPSPPSPSPSPVVEATFVPAPALAISKTSDATGAKLPGEPVTFRLAVTNTGNVPLTTLLVHDEMLDGSGARLYTKDFSQDQLTVGQTMEVSYVMIISRDTPPGAYTNTARATAQYGATTVTSGLATSTVHVGAATVTTTPKSEVVSKPAVKQSKAKLGALAVTQTLQTKKKSYKAGDQLKFRLTVTNTGTTDLKKVVLNEQFINGRKRTITWSLGALKKGVGLAVTYVLTLAKDIRPGSVISRVFANGLLAKEKIASKPTDLRFTVKPVAQPAIRNILASVSSQTDTSTQGLRGHVTRTANGGLAFVDGRGRPITAWQYAKTNSLSMVDLLRDSRDPIDRAFVHAYDSGMALVGKPGRAGTVIRAEDVINELRAAPQFRNLYGDAFAIASR